MAESGSKEENASLVTAQAGAEAMEVQAPALAHPGDAPMPGMPGISIKYFVLLLLTLQNVGAVLMMRFVVGRRSPKT